MRIAKPWKHRAPRHQRRTGEGSVRGRHDSGRRRLGRHKKAVVGVWLPQRVGTTAQLAVTYPCGVPAGIGPAGIVIGHDRLADGLFCFDPFAAYTAGLVTNPNMFIMGRPGTGKSTTVKLLLSRAATVLDRELVIVDPKGEYTALADSLGLEQIRLAPGGTVQVNPLHIPDGLDPATTALIGSRRVGILAGMAAELLGRPVRPLERAALDWTLTALDQDCNVATIDGVPAGEPTIDGVCALLRQPTDSMCDEANMAVQELTAAVSDLRLALTRLVTGDLAGMFNPVPRPGPSARTEPQGRAGNSRGLVVDLSAVIGDDTAIRLAMIATVGWLNNTTATSTVSSEGTVSSEVPMGQRARIQVIDEAWRLLSSVEGVRYLQSCWKLGRTFGTANVFVTHTIADLGAQGDTDSAATKIALTLLSDSATRVTLAQSDDALTATQTALGLTDTETDLVGRLEQGVAYWQVGQHRTIVETIPTSHELAMIDTDQNMRPTPHHEPALATAGAGVGAGAGR